MRAPVGGRIAQADRLQVGQQAITGLPVLTIVANIVEMHGGRVWVESRPGEGATFHVELPREVPAEVVAG